MEPYGNHFILDISIKNFFEGQQGNHSIVYNLGTRRRKNSRQVRFGLLLGEGTNQIRLWKCTQASCMWDIVTRPNNQKTKYVRESKYERENLRWLLQYKHVQVYLSGTSFLRGFFLQALFQLLFPAFVVAFTPSQTNGIRSGTQEPKSTEESELQFTQTWFTYCIQVGIYYRTTGPKRVFNRRTQFQNAPLVSSVEHIYDRDKQMRDDRE